MLDELLSVDIDTLADSEVHDTVIALQHVGSRLAAVSSRFVQRWDTRQIWADDGSRAAGARLAREANMSPRAAAMAVRRARRLTSMPATTAALAAGQITTDHVDVLAAANKRDWSNGSFADAEPMLVGFCATMWFDHARRAVSYWIANADPDDDETSSQRLHESRRMSASVTFDGAVAIDAMLDPVGGAAVMNELERIMSNLRDDDLRDGNDRTITQRRADALVEMAHRSRTSVPGGLRPRPLITVLVGEASFTRTCELANGYRIAPGQLVPLLGDADIERIVFDGPDRVLSVSRKRSFTGALRRAIEVRDRHCTHPAGCTTPAEHCDIDHTHPHSHGGITSQHNGRLRCPTHNRNHTKRNQHPQRPAPSNTHTTNRTNTATDNTHETGTDSDDPDRPGTP